MGNLGKKNPQTPIFFWWIPALPEKGYLRFLADGGADFNAESLSGLSLLDMTLFHRRGLEMAVFLSI